MIQTILSIVFLVIMCLLIWFFKYLLPKIIEKKIDVKYEKELEKYRQDLRAEKDTAITQYKADLDQKTQTVISHLTSGLRILESQNNVRFSKVFEKTADVIAILYGKLVELEGAVHEYTMPHGPDHQKRTALKKSLDEKMNAFQEYFSPNRLYIPKETAVKVWECFVTMHQTSLLYFNAVAESSAQTRAPESIGKLFDAFFESSRAITPLLTLLHDDFQKHLGLTKETGK